MSPRTYLGLHLFVGVRFQVYFTPLVGVLFTFPSRYCSLSVAEEYLGLESGLPMFRQDFTCPALLEAPESQHPYGAITH